MTQEEKQLLINDIYAKAPYGIKVWYPNGSGAISTVKGIVNDICYFNENPRYGNCCPIESVKPYLRPMSSMTYEEMQDAREKFFDGSDHYDIDNIGEIYADTYQPYTSVYTLSFVRLSGYINWLNAHHFDYRWLIEKGLALKAPNGIYKID